MREQQIRQVADAIADALRQTQATSCCGSEAGESEATKPINVEVSGCCDDTAGNSDAARVVCICIGDKETCS